MTFTIKNISVTPLYDMCNPLYDSVKILWAACIVVILENYSFCERHYNRTIAFDHPPNKLEGKNVSVKGVVPLVKFDHLSCD